MQYDCAYFREGREQEWKLIVDFTTKCLSAASYLATGHIQRQLLNIAQVNVAGLNLRMKGWMRMSINYKQIKAIEKKNKERILKLCPEMPDCSGIYIFTREEQGFKYAYVGQAKRILSRVAQHLTGYQHIDLSIKKHGLFNKDNPTGYKIKYIAFLESELNAKEQQFIQEYAAAGYQMRNATSGSQGKGKHGLDNTKAPKGYYDGLKQGYKNAQKEISHLFEKHLDFSMKGTKHNTYQEKAFQKFKDFLTLN